MEVLTFITSNKQTLSMFLQFLESYEKVYLEDQDNDTLYFNKTGSDKHEIYFHKYFDDVENEFSYNYSDEEQASIQSFFESQDIFIFSLQFRNEKFLNELLDDFMFFLKKKKFYSPKSLLVFHPIRGLVEFAEINSFT